ncbi:MAG: hypothetical protein IJ124_08875 [Clostridia bacterium]|nr:hypothetical protein [Clostridia bacterium]
MDQTVQLLQDVVRNARTGQDAVEQLMTKAQDRPMRDELIREKEAYAMTCREGERALLAAGGKAEPVKAMTKAGMWIGLEAETLADRTDAHIAEMVIQGATMGIIEMTKALNSYEGADTSARDIARSFVDRQNDVIVRQKAFLKN